MTTLRNAPLQYVLAIIHFPPIMNMQKHIAVLQDAFRQEYPELDTIASQSLTTQAGSEGLKLDISTETVWQFARADRSMALVLGSEFLVLHCGGGYPGHEEFIKRMAEAVACLRDAEGVRISHINAVGYRYVDLIEPSGEEALADYLRAWALPMAVPGLEDSDIVLQQFSYQAAFVVAEGVLRFHANLRPPTTMPPDLVSPFLQANGWHTDRPKGDFAVLDFDHGRAFKSPMPLDPQQAAAHLLALHGPTRRLFDAAVTEHAIKTWSTP